MRTHPRPSHALNEHERRAREHRHSVMLSGSINRRGSPHCSTVVIRNISSGGLMCECTQQLRNGEKVEIELPRIGVLSGRICWEDARRIGVAFDAPIEPTLAWTRPTASRPRVPRPREDLRRPGLVSRH